MSPISLAAVLGILILIVFLSLGIARFSARSSYSAYFLASRAVNKSANSASYIARFTSLATVLGFFLIFAKFDGLFLLVAPITVLLGIVFFSFLMRRSIKLRHSSEERHSSMAEMIGSYFDSKWTGVLITGISLFTVFCTLLIELYVGVQIFSLFVQDTNQLVPIAMVLVGIPVFVYVCAGGLETVVVTDRLQSYLIWAFVIVLLGYVVLFGRVSSQTIIPRPMIGEGVFILPYALLANIVVVNIFLFPTLYSTWQMRLSSKSDTEFVDGTINGAWGVAILWTSLVFCGVGLGAIVPAEVFSIAELTEALAFNGDTLVRWLIFPLFFVASISALISTADSAIVPLAQAAYDVVRGPQKDFSRVTAVSLVLSLFVFAIAIYILVFGVLEYNFIDFLFSVFGYAVAAAPIILWMLLFPNDLSRTKRATVFSVFAVLGFIAALICSSYGNATANPAIVQLSAPIAFAVSLLGPIISRLQYATTGS